MVWIEEESGLKKSLDEEESLGRRPTHKLPVASATGLELTMVLRPEADTSALRVVSPSGLEVRVDGIPGPDGPAVFVSPSGLIKLQNL